MSSAYHHPPLLLYHLISYKTTWFFLFRDNSKCQGADYNRIFYCGAQSFYKKLSLSSYQLESCRLCLLLWN